MKRAGCFTDYNLPLMLMESANKVESHEMWLPIVFGGNVELEIRTIISSFVWTKHRNVADRWTEMV